MKTNNGYNATSFKKGTYRKYPYSDPTYLSFLLLFSWDDKKSPLFNGEAAAFLRDVYKDEIRAQKLEKFTKYFKKINTEMPWMFQSLAGLESAFAYNNLEDPYWGGDDSAFEIGCLETIDLTMGGIMSLYRDVAYDFQRWIEVLPHNLREFTMYVKVCEIRNIRSTVPDSSKKPWSDAKSEEREYIPVNQELTADFQPHFMFKFKSCYFDLSSGTGIFGEYSNADYTEAKNKIKIKWKSVKEYSSLFLNGFDTGASNNNNLGGTSIGELGSGTSRLEKVKAFGENIKDAFQQAKDGTLKDNIKENVSAKLDGIKPSVGDVKSFAQQAAEGLAEDALTSAEDAARGAIQDKLADAILGNVYGVNTLSNVQDALNAGSLNGVRNLINKETISDNAGDEAPLTSINVYPESSPETTLSPDNIYPNIESEAPMSSDNIYPETSPETTLSPDNVFPNVSPENPLSPDNVYPEGSTENPLSPENVFPNIDPEKDANLGNINN